MNNTVWLYLSTIESPKSSRDGLREFGFVVNFVVVALTLTCAARRVRSDHCVRSANLRTRQHKQRQVARNVSPLILKIDFPKEREREKEERALEVLIKFS